MYILCNYEIIFITKLKNFFSFFNGLWPFIPETGQVNKVVKNKMRLIICRLSQTILTFIVWFRSVPASLYNAYMYIKGSILHTYMTVFCSK